MLRSQTQADSCRRDEMSDETYYTVLIVKETASLSEIKTAYHDLIRQVHPDKIPNLAPYLRKIAEDKAKEINEAYSVLSNSSKRRDYDNQLAAYRRQSAPQAPPAPQPTPTQTGSTSSFGFCNKCGSSLYASGYCPKCSKFGTPTATAKPAATPKVVRRFGYNWGPLLHWAGDHPLIALGTPLVLVLVVVAAISNNDTSQQADSNCPPSQKVEVNGRFVCQPLQRTSSTPATTAPDTQSKTVPTAKANTPSKAASTSKATTDNQWVVVNEEDVEETGAAKNKSVIDLRKKPVIDLRNNSNSKVETADTLAISSTAPDEPHARSSAQPNMSGLTPSERQSIESACSHAKYLEGPAAYDQCLNRQFEAWVSGPREPDLSALTYTERQSIQSACSHAKYLEGPAAYDRCLVRQLGTWEAGPRQPDLSALTPSERQSIQSACSHSKYLEGPAAYNRCLVRQLEALNNYRR